LRSTTGIWNFCVVLRNAVGRVQLTTISLLILGSVSQTKDPKLPDTVWITFFFSLCGFCGLLSFSRPGVAIGLLMCIFGIESLLQSQAGFFVDNGRYVNFGIGAVVAIAAIGCVLRNPKSLSQVSTAQWLVYVLFVYAFTSLMWTLAPDRSTSWVKSLPYCGTYLLLAPLLTRQKNALADGLRWALLIGVPVLLLMAFYCEWGHRGLILSKPILTDLGIDRETQPLATASLGASLAIIALVAHFKKAVGFWLRFLIFALGLYISFKTEARGQVLAVIGVSAIIYPISNRATSIKGAVKTSIGFAVVGLTTYFLFQSLELVRFDGARLENAIEGRRSLTNGLLDYWASNIGAFTIMGFGASSSWRVIGAYPHNLPIEILFELGLIGFGIFISIVVVCTRNGLQVLSRLEGEPQLRSQIVALIGIIGLLLAESLKSGTLYNWQSLFFFLVCLDQQVTVKTKELGSVKKALKGLFVLPVNAPRDPAFRRQAF